MTMTIQVTKEDLINMICSVTPSSYKECDDYTKLGLMKFTGNQWNEDWSWVKSELAKLPEYKLYELYNKHK